MRLWRLRDTEEGKDVQDGVWMSGWEVDWKNPKLRDLKTGPVNLTPRVPTFGTPSIEKLRKYIVVSTLKQALRHGYLASQQDL